jgi:hypothetical protein
MIPCYDNGQDRINKKNDRESYLVEIKKDRNPKFHRKYMAILRMVVANDHKKRWHTVDLCLNAVKISLGYYDIEVDMMGRKFPAPRSINFETMGDDEFDEKIYKPSLPLLAEILGCTPEELDDVEQWEKFAE